MKSRILLIFFISFFTLLSGHAQTSETEPNNTKAQANVIAISATGTGHINPAGDNDWWQITTTSDGELTISVSDFSSDYTNFYLYDNNGTTVLNNGTVGSNTTNVFSTDGLAAGTYYIEFTGYYATDTSTYSFTTTFTPPPVANDAEPDSTRALALTLPLDGSVTGHIGYYYNNHRDSSDWYKVTTNSDGLLRLNITTEPSTLSAYINYYLYDNDGVTLLSSNTTGSNTTNSYSIDGLAAGTYYVKMSQYNVNDYVSYKLADSLFAPPVANDIEPDSTRAQALILPLDGGVTGHIGYYYNNHRDSSDWYKVTTNSDGLLRLNITTEPSTLSAYINYYLYDNDGVTLLSSNTTGSNTTNSYSIDGLAAGTYYVKMSQYNVNDYVSYKLADSLFAPPVANDIEPNNTEATADSFPLNTTITGHLGYYYNNHRDSSDWYKVTTNTDGMLQFTITTEPSSLNAYINYALYDNDGTTVIASSTIGSVTTNVYNIDGLAKGTYYLRIYQYTTSDYVSYKVKDSLYTYLYAADSSYEPNNYAAQAKTILSNRTTTGHFGFYINGGRTADNTDWFRLNYTGTGNLSLTLNHLPHISDGAVDYVNFAVYQDTTASPVYSTTFGGETTDNVNLTNLTEGYYYIKISQYNSNDFEAYSLSNSFTQVNIAAISVKSTVSSPDSCSGNSVTYNLSKSHAPYTVRLYHNGIIYDSSITAVDTARFSNLPAGNYYATVYGDGATDSAYGKSVVTQFLPPYPTVLTTTGIGVHTAQLNWITLSCVKSYRVQYKLSSASTWTAVDDPNDATGIYKLSGLSPYTNYTWRVASVDTAQGAAIISAYSDSMRFITLSDTAHITRAGKTQGTTCSSSMLVYNLSNSVAPYTVQLYRYNLVDGSTVQATGTATFANLPSGIYYATATGTGSGGSLGTSSFDTITPPVPSGLDTTKVGTTSAKLNWTAISCVQYFSIQYKVVGAANWTTLATKGNVSSDSLTGLLANTKYVWQIASADSANGYTLFSNYSVVDTFMTMSLLPVTLIQFDATGVNNTVQLTWQTATETNNKYFAVQRSSDGITFSTVGTVSSFGNSTLQHQYSFTDNSPVRGTNYYRLRQVDNNGYFVDSKTVTVSFNGTLLFTLYPNPAASVVHVNLSSSSPATIVMYDMNGKAIAQKEVSSGVSSQTIDVSKLAAGTYTIVLLQDKRQQSLKFVKK